MQLLPAVSQYLPCLFLAESSLLGSLLQSLRLPEAVQAPKLMMGVTPASQPHALPHVMTASKLHEVTHMQT